MLCSDGLTGMVEDEAISTILSEPDRDPEEACRLLVEAANAAGGEDNITVVAIRAALPA